MPPKGKKEPEPVVEEPVEEEEEPEPEPVDPREEPGSEILTETRLARLLNGEGQLSSDGIDVIAEMMGLKNYTIDVAEIALIEYLMLGLDAAIQSEIFENGQLPFFHVLQLNLYKQCHENPVMKRDEAVQYLANLLKTYSISSASPTEKLNVRQVQFVFQYLRSTFLNHLHLYQCMWTTTPEVVKASVSCHFDYPVGQIGGLPLVNALEASVHAEKVAAEEQALEAKRIKWESIMMRLEDEASKEVEEKMSDALQWAQDLQNMEAEEAKLVDGSLTHDQVVALAKYQAARNLRSTKASLAATVRAQHQELRAKIAEKILQQRPKAAKA